MKKIKKILSVLSAAAVIAAGIMSVSAETIDFDDIVIKPGGLGLVDFDNIIFSSKSNYSDSYYKYGELLIDKDGHINNLEAYSCALAVKMKDGEKPPEGYERPFSEGVEEIITVEEFTKYQKALFKNQAFGRWGYLHLTDIELTDNLYLVSGFRGGYKAVSEYCEKLLESGTVEFAEPLISARYSVIYPGDIKYLKEYGIDTDKFGKGFVFAIEFESTEQAEAFDAGSIAGFEEKLYVMEVIDDKIYFQFTSDIDKTDMGYMLNTIQNAENVKSVNVTICSVLESGSSGYINGIPKSCDTGDINEDNKIDLQDIVSLSKHLVKQTELTKPQFVLADVNEDGRVNVFDVISLSRELLSEKN